MLYELLQHPDILAEARAEADRVFADGVLDQGLGIPGNAPGNELHVASDDEHSGVIHSPRTRRDPRSVISFR